MLLVCLLTGCQQPRAQTTAPQAPAVPVSVAVAASEAVPVDLRVIGTVEPSATVQVKSQIAGELIRVRFAEGQNVTKGALLFEIDPRPYEQAVRQAEAALAKDAALLRQAEANLARDIAQSKNAETDAARYDQLAKEGVVSKAQHDQVRTSAEALRESIQADRAAIESARATLESDRAAADKAKLDLSYCSIRSPITGRAGNLLVHAGNLVKANGDNALVVIHQVTPIFVSFSVPEQHLAAIRKFSAKGPLTVQVAPQDAPDQFIRGALRVIDNTVDPTTGTIRLKATFANENRALWPGQFVNVVLTLATQRDATVVPAEAVQAGQKGQFVYVVKPDQTVELRPVTVGATVFHKVIVEKGVSPGETVVTDGQLRLFPGARIKAVPAGKLEAGAG